MRLRLALLLFSIASVFNSQSQYCAGGPSNTTWSNVESVSINGENISSINYSGCPGQTGVEYYTTESVTLNSGGSYSATILFGTCDNVWDGSGQAWIDYNQNQIFEASESIGSWSGTPPSTEVFNFTVPGSLANGTTRMRVMQQEDYPAGSAALPLDPCATFQYGSVTDFDIIIQGGVASYCNAGPTSTAFSNVEAVTINGENSSSINYTGCPGQIGLETYSVETVDLAPGLTYNLDVIFGTCGGVYDGYGQAWIDYNENTIFEVSESLGTWQGTPSSLNTFNFTVPASASIGSSTRMRVMQVEDWPLGTYSLPLDPCASYTWGSATDFTVNFQQGVDCNTFIGDENTDPIVVSTLPYAHNHSNVECYSDKHPVHPSPDVYYKVTVDPLNPIITASLCGSNFDTHITVEEFNGTFIAGNDDAISCAPQSEVSFNASGYSYVYIIVEGWGSDMGTYTLNINGESLGLNQLNSDLFAIQPNPANNNVQISTRDSGVVKLIDIKGELIATEKINQKLNLDVSKLPAGVYIIQLNTSETLGVKKLIVK